MMDRLRELVDTLRFDPWFDTRFRQVLNELVQRWDTEDQNRPKEVNTFDHEAAAEEPSPTLEPEPQEQWPESEPEKLEKEEPEHKEKHKSKAHPKHTSSRHRR